MAEIIDQRDPDLQDGEEFGDISDLGKAPEPIEEEEVVDQVEEEAEPEVQIPDKFKGKSIEDIVHSYTELEREYGRRSNEVGELRKLTDEILKSQLQVNAGGSQTAKKKTEVDDLLENPDQVIEDAVSNNPKLRQLEEQLLNAKREEAKSKFEAKHPNAYDLVQDPSFQNWVAASNIRQQLFLDAHQNYNYDAASELIELYEQVAKASTDAVRDERKSKREQTLKDAVTEKGSSGQSSKKIYKRTDILKLMKTNRKAYDDPVFQAELTKAYQEGRVR